MIYAHCLDKSEVHIMSRKVCLLIVSRFFSVLLTVKKYRIICTILKTSL